MLQLRKIHFSHVFLFLNIESVVVEVNKSEKHDREGIANDKTDLTSSVSRCLLGNEGLWSNKVSDTVTDKEHGVGSNLLCVASGIRSKTRQRTNGCNRVHKHKVVTCKSDVLVVGKGQQARGHQGNRHSEDGNGQTVLEVLDTPCETNTTDKLDGTGWHVHVQGLLGVEAKVRVQQDTGEVCQSTVGNVVGDGEEEEKPRVDVGHGLNELVLLEMLVTETLLVSSDSLHLDQLLLVSQEPGLSGGVWHVEHE